jgi:hypothetical protein
MVDFKEYLMLQNAAKLWRYYQDEFLPAHGCKSITDLVVERDSLREQLRLAQEQLEEADKLIAHAVQIMEPEQVGQWTGVRVWQESWQDEIAPAEAQANYKRTLIVTDAALSPTKVEGSG